MWDAKNINMFFWSVQLQSFHRNLGEIISAIELDTPAVSQQQQEEIEQVVNEKIRQQVPVTPRLFPDKNDPQLQQVQPVSASVSAGVDGYGGYGGISAWWMSPGFLDDEYVGCVHSISRTCFVLAVFHRHVFTQFHGVGARFVFMDWYSCCVSWTCGVHKETGSCAQTHSLFFSFLRHYCIFVSSFFSTQNWFLIQFRARGLPDDHEGPVRVLDIEGVDATLCCGTHVSNLSHLQVMKSCRIYQGSGLSLVGAATSIIFVATKVLCLSQQK